MEEMLNVVDQDGVPTGEKISRIKAHMEGIRHGASHIFVYRIREEKVEILLQRRSDRKDSYPECLDISSAGHMEWNMGYLETAQKALGEELGIYVKADKLQFCFSMDFVDENRFYDRKFVNKEFVHVYLLERDLEPSELVLQTEEVSEILWMDAEEIIKQIQKHDAEICIEEKEYQRVLLCIKAKILFGKGTLTWKRRKQINDAGDLWEFLKTLSDTVKIGTYRKGYSEKDMLYPGIYVSVDGYCRTTETFRDAFGFGEDMDISFYDATVYVHDETGEFVCMEIFPSICDKFCSTRQMVNTVTELKESIKRTIRDYGKSVPLISTDENFELGGSVTQGVWLELYEERDNKKQWVMLETE